MGVLKRTVGAAYGYVEGKSNDSLNVRPAYGVSSGPEMVAVQRRRFSGLLGKAEMPGVVDIMSCMSSVCRLGTRDQFGLGNGLGTQVRTYRLVTLWVSCRRTETFSLAASCIVAVPGAWF